MTSRKRADAGKPQPSQPQGVKAGDGRQIFELAKLERVESGPGYSTVAGSYVEGERIRTPRTASRGPPWAIHPLERITSLALGPRSKNRD